jgi:outer membrane cobalamin receptor
MTTAKRTLGLVIAGMAMLATARADPLAQAVSGNKNGEDEKAVFVTGSLIPKRVKIKAIGTNTTAPLRVFTRAEMDRTGRFTTEGILAQDPSVRIIGNGSH